MVGVREKATTAEICKSFMEAILWHLVNPSSDYLNHDRLCEQAGVGVKAKDSVRHLKDLWIVCSENNCPNLALLVINQRHNKMPGNWYFDVYEAINPTVQYQRSKHYKEEVQKIKSYLNWHQLAQKYELSDNLILQLSLRSLRLQELEKEADLNKNKGLVSL